MLEALMTETKYNGKEAIAAYKVYLESGLKEDAYTAFEKFMPLVHSELTMGVKSRIFKSLPEIDMDGVKSHASYKIWDKIINRKMRVEKYTAYLQKVIRDSIYDVFREIKSQSVPAEHVHWPVYFGIREVENQIFLSELPEAVIKKFESKLRFNGEVEGKVKDACLYVANELTQQHRDSERIAENVLRKRIKSIYRVEDPQFVIDYVIVAFRSILMDVKEELHDHIYGTL